MGWNAFKSCKDCKHCNTSKHPIKTTGSGSFTDSRPDYERFWCSKRGTYVYSMDAQSWCFEEGSSGSGCFLTTACVAYKGLPDDCAELTALRRFRDTYLKSTDAGTALVKEYYEIAPAIVARIERSAKKDAIYAFIYEEIKACIACIEAGDNEGAVKRYRDMVKKADEMADK